MCKGAGIERDASNASAVSIRYIQKHCNSLILSQTGFSQIDFSEVTLFEYLINRLKPIELLLSVQV